MVATPSGATRLLTLPLVFGHLFGGREERKRRGLRDARGSAGEQVSTKAYAGAEVSAAERASASLDTRSQRTRHSVSHGLVDGATASSRQHLSAQTTEPLVVLDNGRAARRAHVEALTRAQKSTLVKSGPRQEEDDESLPGERPLDPELLSLSQAHQRRRQEFELLPQDSLHH